MVNYEWLLDRPDFFEKAFKSSGFNRAAQITVEPYVRAWSFIQAADGLGLRDYMRPTLPLIANPPGPTGVLDGLMFFGHFDIMWISNSFTVVQTIQYELGSLLYNNTFSQMSMPFAIGYNDAINTYARESVNSPRLFNYLAFAASDPCNVRGNFVGLKISYKS